MIRPYYLLDTNIVSEIMKPKPDEEILSKIQKYENLSSISSTTWNELLFGVNIMEAGKKRDTLFELLVKGIQSSFEIIHYDNHAAWIQADIRARLKKNGNPIEFDDTQIASIAVANNMILVTSNIKHFEPVQQVAPLMLENWFEE